MAVSQEPLSDSAPVLLRDGYHNAMRVAKELGYDGIELQLRNPETVDADALLADSRLLDIGISAIATGLEYSLNGFSMIDDCFEKRRMCIAQLKAHAQLAKKLCCPMIIGCVRGNIRSGADRDMYIKRFTDGLYELAETGAQIVIEAINFYVNNYFCSVPETLEFIESLELENLKIHIDTHHMNIEDMDASEAVRRCGKLLGYVHFAENNRLYPGGGRLDFRAVMEELEQIGYQGYISLECVPKPDGYAAAKLGIAHLKALERKNANGNV